MSSANMHTTPEVSGFILFDLDGTLIDGVDDLLMAINIVLADAGLAPLARPALEGMLGDGMRTLAQRAFAARNRLLSDTDSELVLAAFLRAYEATHYAHTRLYDGVADTLRQLHAEGWRIGLASNKLSGPCNEILLRLGIRELFAVVAGGDATTVKKPAGGHLLYALAKMGYQPTQAGLAVMVGDHANDVDAARAAGIMAIAVALEVDDSHARSLGADAVVSEFSTLPGVLAALQQA
jgi:phosphoglycolate phosphatase